MFEKKVQEMLYAKAASPEDLPWHCDEPAKLLVQAVAKRSKPGQALDLGCGSGVFSVYLAKQGFAVTGLDFIPKALNMAKERARKARVEVSWVLADLLEWKSAESFDLILDSGCLHNVTSRNIAKYKRQLLSWTSPQSDFILAHWGKRHVFDWRPIGPKRRTRQQLVRFFSPEFQERAHDQEILKEIPLPIGPTVLGQCFWFHRVA